MSTGTVSLARTRRARRFTCFTVFLFTGGAPAYAQGPLNVRTEAPDLIIESGERLVLRYRYTDVPCKPYVQERRTFEVYAGGDLDATLLTWQSHLSVVAGKLSVELTGSAYFGLGMRFPRTMDVNGQFVNADGRIGVAGTNERRAAWIAYRAQNEASSALDVARRNASQAGATFSEIQRWLHDVALPAIDHESKLFRATGDTWSYRDTAADCYPFLAWAALFTDRKAFDGVVHDVLRAERQLGSEYGPIPVDYDFRTRRKRSDASYESVVFGASEYMKDGLVAIAEAAGPGPWLDRMRAITDELWRRADIDTPYGPLVSSNLEVNGDQLQVLVRLFGFTGDHRYLEYAQRIADFYLNDPTFVPRHLDDHGCELIGGIGLLQGVEAGVDPISENTRRPRIKKMLDTILERGLNSDGLMLHTLAETPGPHDDVPLTDNWGYNYVSHFCYYLVTGDVHYRDVLRRPLVNLSKPKYHLYPWEGTNIDGHADSIEGAIYLLSVVPVPQGQQWVDREVTDALLAEPIRGTSKFECNAIRTLTLYALSKTQGIHADPWRADLQLGAARTGDGVVVHVVVRRPWSGKLVFDIPRHRRWLHFKHDWPRINYLPEYFTVAPTRRYRVRSDSSEERMLSGQALRDGLRIRLGADESLTIVVVPAD